jgi:hypothetical protein
MSMSRHGFSKSLSTCSAYVAELWEVFEELKYAGRLGFDAVELNIVLQLLRLLRQSCLEAC